MFIWARFSDPSARAEPVLVAAIEEGMAFVPGSAFRPDGVDTGTLRLCFTTQAAENLDEAMRRLATATARRSATRADVSALVAGQPKSG